MLKNTKTFILGDDDDHFRDECGIFGIYEHPDAAAHTALGLHALQHRGQEAAGVVSYDGHQFNSHRALGHVGDNFNSEGVIATLPGNMAIGHVRYSTSGDKALRNVQPLFADFKFGGLSIAHNGNLTNAYAIRKALVERGCIFQSTSDTETFIHLIAISKATNVVERVIDALRQVEGAYSLVAMTKEKIIGVRDPRGVRPLVIGKIGNSMILASETCALDIIGAKFVRDVEPGELVVINKNGLLSFKPFLPILPKFCVFEYIYFARPDSYLEGRNVYQIRKKIGMELAKESDIDADVIVPVPDSGVPAALGYAEQSSIPFELGIIRNHYVGRTFIEPTQQIRNLGVKLKHNANAHFLEGKRVVLIDDSIVRGTTSIKIVDMVRAAGATEVHMCVSSPPITNPCFYGIDTPEREELMAHIHDLESMRKVIGVDSLNFISFDGLYRAVGEKKRDVENPQFCDACFSGDYPIRLSDLENGNAPKQLSLLKTRD